MFFLLLIDILKITERLTGTEPFNNASGSNSNGVDISPDDNYVRTNDSINYTLEVRILGTADYEDKSGGILKIKGTLPNQGSPILMVFEEQAWMQNTILSDDKTEIYTEFHFDSNQTPIGNQTVTFTVKTLGYKKTITDAMKPTFELWMEGNKPDNPSSSIASKTVKDTLPTIINVADSTIFSLEKTEVKVTRANNSDVTSNYSIEISNGGLIPLAILGKDGTNNNNIVVTLEYDSVVGNGEEKKPRITNIHDNELNVDLLEDESYTYTYFNNMYPGTGEVRIEFKGNYKGNRTVTFVIE